MAETSTLIFDDLFASAANEENGEIKWGEKTKSQIVIQVEKEGPHIKLYDKAKRTVLGDCILKENAVFQLGPCNFMLRLDNAPPKGGFCSFNVQCSTESDGQKLHLALQTAKSEESSLNWFERKTDKGSAELYFHYYGTLQHQQNMMQDYIRTGTYYSAIVNNRSDFEGKVVMDVGAGSGILSLFAAQAGAKKVYAVEASVMAKYARQLVASNPGMANCIEVIQGKVEEVEVSEKVDVLISEPIGTLLVNERMLETYLYARERFLKPGGKMFPKLGRIHVAAFSDEILYNELLTKGAFWMQENFYGVNVAALHPEAVKQYFSQVVVDAFDPGLLVSASVMKVVDFSEIGEEELYDLEIPLAFTIVRPCQIHGVACWFDIYFDGSTKPEWLNTAPGQPATHWFQLRCVMERPVWAIGGSQVVGSLRLVAHCRQSYDVHVSLEVPPISPGFQAQKTSGVLDLKEPYYRQLTSWWHGQGSPQVSQTLGQAAGDGCIDTGG